MANFEEKSCGKTLVCPELVVIQPTSLCNLNCSYCYVPDRRNSKTMDLDTLEAIFKKTLAHRNPDSHVFFLYHAGEPLTVPMSFYQSALALGQRYNTGNYRLEHDIQTNGTLVTKDWCRFFEKENIRIGVSLDGPEFLHDSFRRNWSDKGSFLQAIRGLKLIQEHNISCGVLTVITEKHLDYPDELFSFYLDNQIQNVGLCIEEVIGSNIHSSFLPSNDSTKALNERLAKYERFISRLFFLWEKNRDKIKIREFDGTVSNMAKKAKNPSFIKASDESEAFLVLTIQRNGDISTYSPELAGMKSFKYNNFVIGNINTINSLQDLSESQYFLTLKQDVNQKKSWCSRECSHFSLCGSGETASRYLEAGNLDEGVSMSCILRAQIINSVIIKGLNSRKDNALIYGETS